MFQAPKLTNAGKALYYANMAGEQIEFTTIQLGSGAISGAIANMTALINPVVTITAAVTVSDSFVDVSGAFSNEDLTAGFYWREIGVFAANPNYPNDRTKDILYCYQNAYDTADFIPLASVETVEKSIVVPVIVGDATAVSCTLSKSLIYATAQDMTDHNTDETAHPDIRGLIQTAENQITAVGQNLAAHNEDTENPHAVTFEQVAGQAILPIEKGGTDGETAEEALYNLQNPLSVVTAVDTDDYMAVEVAADGTMRKISIGDLKDVLGVVSPTIAVTTYSGATVTCTDGTTTLTGTGSCAFSLPNIGTWTVSAAYGGKTVSKAVTVNGPIQYNVTLNIPSSLAVSGYQSSFEYSAALVFGGTATVTYYGGATASVTPTLSPATGAAMTTIGTNTITASYTENGVTVSTTYSVTVTKKSLTVPAQSGTLTYSGSAQAPAWDSNYNASLMTLGGTTSGTNAASYSATFTLSDTTHYQWADGTTAAKTVTWTIGTKSISGVTITLGTSLTYTGSSQTQAVSSVKDGSTTLTSGTDYTISGNTGTNAGSYTLTVTGTGNYTGTATKTWTIAKAAGAVSVSPTSLTISGAVGLTGTVTVTRSGDGNITCSSGATGIATASNTGVTVTVTSVATGTATITISVAEGTNYLAASVTFSVTVTICNVFSYTGTYELSNSNHILKLKTSGVLVMGTSETLQYAIIGAGGGGGYANINNLWSGAGGSGGVQAQGSVAAVAQTGYTAQVGAGGTGALSGVDPVDGGASSMFAISAAGGTSATTYGAQASAGTGSGAGAAGSSSTGNGAAGGAGGSVTLGGYALGYFSGGGGAGGRTTTGESVIRTGGAGGNYGGGAGGDAYYGTNSSTAYANSGTNGVANTGGGGGGAGCAYVKRGSNSSGGSGVIFLYSPLGFQLAS